MLLAIAGTAVPATAGDFVMDTHTSVRLYGGVGLWGPETFNIDLASGQGAVGTPSYPAVAVYGFSVQRDLLPRFALELDIQNADRNTFPSFADYGEVANSIEYHGIEDLPAFKDYMDEWIADGKNPNSVEWIKHNTVTVTMRPVLHIVNTPRNRLSAYAGIGFYSADGVGFKVNCFLPTVTPEDYTTSFRQYHIFGLAGAAGLRYEYTFAEHYMVGADFGAVFNDNLASWHDEISLFNWYDVRALLYVGIRF